MTLSEKEDWLEALYFTLLIAFCIGDFVVLSMFYPRGACHKTEVNYYYDVNTLFVENYDGKTIGYQAIVPTTGESVDVPYDKVYVFHQNDVVTHNKNTLKETTYTSLLFDKKETDYELYIFVQESKGEN